MAIEACDLTEYKAAHILSTLGAAYAETGDFPNAIKWVEKGIQIGNDEEKKALAKELESYRAGKPVRERFTEGPPDVKKPEAKQPEEKKPEEKKPEEKKPEEKKPDEKPKPPSAVSGGAL